MPKYVFCSKENFIYNLYSCDTDIEVQILANTLPLEQVQDLIRIKTEDNSQTPLIDFRTVIDK